MARDLYPLFNSISRCAWTSLVLAACAMPPTVHAQSAGVIYRCGSEYTNNPSASQKKDCKLLEGGNITVVPATRVNGGGNKANAAQSSPDQPRVDPGQQKARDSDAKAILEAELKRAEARLADAQREYNGGQVDKQGLEFRNIAKYNERVLELKAAVTRAEADVAGLKRELARAGGNANTTTNPAGR